MATVDLAKLADELTESGFAPILGDDKLYIGYPLIHVWNDGVYRNWTTERQDADTVARSKRADVIIRRHLASDAARTEGQ